MKAVPGIGGDGKASYGGLGSCHADVYLEASGRLKEQSRLSLTIPPSVRQVVDELHAFAVAQQERGYAPAVLEMEDSILIASADGDRELVATRDPAGWYPAWRVEEFQSSTRFSWEGSMAVWPEREG